MSEAPKLTGQAIHAIVLHCLFNSDEPTDDAVITEGIMRKFAFHPGRLAEKGDEIAALLTELPDEFQQDKGGGWSFLNACNDKHGRQWTGEHQEMEALFVLGIAAGKARWLMPRETWSAFPGGMPYVAVLSAQAGLDKGDERYPAAT